MSANQEYEYLDSSGEDTFLKILKSKPSKY